MTNPSSRCLFASKASRSWGWFRIDIFVPRLTQNRDSCESHVHCPIPLANQNARCCNVIKHWTQRTASVSKRIKFSPFQSWMSPFSHVRLVFPLGVKLMSSCPSSVVYRFCIITFRIIICDFGRYKSLYKLSRNKQDSTVLFFFSFLRCHWQVKLEQYLN